MISKRASQTEAKESRPDHLRLKSHLSGMQRPSSEQIQRHARGDEEQAAPGFEMWREDIPDSVE